MPICLHSDHFNYDPAPGSKWLCEQPCAEFQDRSSKCINIGLINNMGDGALQATERHFLSLLDSASDGISIRLTRYSLPGILRSESAARYVQDFYSSTESLLNTRLDGLIVTGREPSTPSLSEEPYWESLVRVLEWAPENTHSSVWSCLAAHAAILHMDGIGRVKSSLKHCGIFECARVSDHLLTARTPARFALPHSRWNGVPEETLTSRGYNVLTRSTDAGVDTFVKTQKSLFVFLQGHPEYESNTLLLEYRRDVGRYFRGETDTYPSMPRSYFDHGTVNALTALQEEALSHPREELLAQVTTVLEEARIENTWHATAAGIYRNWLDYICAQKRLRFSGSKFAVQLHGADRLAPALATVGDTSVS
jgi:homoserine O-succinyltransferase